MEKNGIPFFEGGKYLITYNEDVLLNADFDVYDLNDNYPSSFLKISIIIINKSQSKITCEIIIIKNLISGIKFRALKFKLILIKYI